MKGGIFFMGRKSQYTIEQKIQAVEDYKSGKRGTMQICNDLNIRKISLYRWVAIYEDFGEAGFLPKPRNKAYSKELKEEAINDYLSGKGSYRDIARKYEISNGSILEVWVSKYNGYEKLKDYNPKGEVYMTKGRKTTVEERQEIVAYCLEHDREYKLAVEHFNVSYAQVYQWVKKFEERGERGLQDKRGKRKQEEELSEIEKLQRENKRLKHQLELQERENILLKKVKEIERRQYSPKGSKKGNI